MSRQIIGTEGDIEKMKITELCMEWASSVVDTKLVYSSNRVLEGEILCFNSVGAL